MNKFRGKVAVITGGARDIGRAVSIKLAKKGAKVVVNYFNNEDNAIETVKIIEHLGGQAISVKGDVSKLEDIKNLVSKTQDAFGDRVDILVNVAGGRYRKGNRGADIRTGREASKTASTYIALHSEPSGVLHCSWN